MGKRYTKPQHIFALGLPLVWVVLNLLFFKFRPDTAGFRILTAAVLLVDIFYLLLPAVYRRIFAGWTWVTRKIGKFNTLLLLGIVFYLLFTPLSLLFKLLGKDLLQEKTDPSAASYWLKRPDKDKSIEDYKKLF